MLRRTECGVAIRTASTFGLLSTSSCLCVGLAYGPMNLADLSARLA